jgi:hypothetical protein
MIASRVLTCFSPSLRTAPRSAWSGNPADSMEDLGDRRILVRKSGGSCLPQVDQGRNIDLGLGSEKHLQRVSAEPLLISVVMARRTAMPIAIEPGHCLEGS